eukprot:TRINITY_DN29382_c0_g1_i1.p1 TRINITY_DN29382_c0_g1~~TRINITY_DN29382_c0_g1_i1.p1  ORF type:complete len:340 (+),score=86.52 TRINITY_DN29382_c0_g1_i1:117-1136(+)
MASLTQAGAVALSSRLSSSCQCSAERQQALGSKSTASPFTSRDELATLRVSRSTSSQLRRKAVVSAVVEESVEAVSNAASAAGDSVVAEVANLPEADDTDGVASKRKPSPLERGGTLSGSKAEGKDPSAATLGKASSFNTSGEKFSDPRWQNGTWDIAQFTAEGKVDWDAVIDAEVIRRKWLEENPESSTNEAPVVFDTSIVPWWAWVKRFHLPEAEKLNGRAAMVGYAAAWLVDSATGVGLVDQQNSFLGKMLIFVSVAAILLIRKTDDLDTIKNLASEWTFYDRQWQATWKEGPPAASSEAEATLPLTPLAPSVPPESARAPPPPPPPAPTTPPSSE